MIETRYFLYYLLARILIVLLTIFVFPTVGFGGFLQTYWLYLIIVSASYFTYCYYINEEEKKYLYLRNTLLIGNIYLALHLFFRPLLNIEPALFVLLGCLVAGLRYISQLHIKYKRPFYVIGETLSFLILVSGVFYLYPDAPDIQGFIAQQSTQLLVTTPIPLPKQIAYLKLSDPAMPTPREIFFEGGMQFWQLPTTYQISYISTLSESKAQAFLLFADGNLFELPPQTALNVEENTLQQIQPEREVITLQAPRFSSNQKDTSSSLPETYWTATAFYRTALKNHLTEQMGSTFLANPTFQHINFSLLRLLSKIFPGFFSQNLKNYEQFAYYFSFLNQPGKFLDTNKYAISDTINTKETSVFQQLKNNINLTLPNLRIF